MKLLKSDTFVDNIKQIKAINMKNWKELEIGKLFPNPKRGTNKATEFRGKIGETPLIAASGYNEGISYLTTSESARLSDENCLTMSANGAGVGSVFYRSERFIATNDCWVLVNKNLNKYRGLFLATIISSVAKRNFAWTKKPSEDLLLKTKIPLPLDKNEEPDWEYMEIFIKKYLSLYKGFSSTKLEELSKNVKTKTKTTLNKWKEFILCGDNGLFELKNSISKIHNKDIVNGLGNIPYVTRTKNNNGISRYVSKQRIKINRGDCLTIGMDAITIFYQERDFYTGDKIKILRNKNLNKLNSLFLLTVIKSVIKQNFSWGERGMNFNELAKLKIRLPSKDDQPDWRYMEDCIKNLHKKVEIILK